MIVLRTIALNKLERYYYFYNNILRDIKYKGISMNLDKKIEESLKKLLKKKKRKGENVLKGSKFEKAMQGFRKADSDLRRDYPEVTAMRKKKTPRENSSTEYEGPSLSEQIEFIKTFLEGKKVTPPTPEELKAMHDEYEFKSKASGRTPGKPHPKHGEPFPEEAITAWEEEIVRRKTEKNPKTRTPLLPGRKKGPKRNK